MNPKNRSEESVRKKAESLQRKEVRFFIIVMIVFTIGMAILLFYEVSAWWIWYIYFAVWTLIELKIAKNIHLKCWHWLLIIAAIILIDWIVLELVEQLKK